MKNLFCKLFLTSVAAVSTLSLSAQDATARHAFATFNIRYTNTEENVANNVNGYSWDLRAPYVFQIIENYDFDVVGMQEVTGGTGKYSMAHGTGLSQLETVKQEMADYTIIECERDGNSAGKDYSYNVLAFKTARYEKLDHGFFWLSATPDTPSTGWVEGGIRRTCIWAKLKDKNSGEVFYFAVTHVNYGPTEDGPNSGRLIAERLSSIAGDDTPIVLVGDFNMRSADHPEAFREYMSYFSHARMSADEALCVPEDNGQIAWTTTQWTTADKATSGSEFDHIFYRNMHAHNYYVITENFGRGVNPSDHYPVMVEVTLGNDVKDVYVDADATEGGDGSKSAPFNTIADAINTAYAGSTIHITADTYDETLNVVSPVNFVGGYDSSFENIVGKTIIDGLGEKSRMVYSQYSGLYLENFKICNAKSELGTTDGAVVVDGSALKLKNCELTGSTAYTSGAALLSTASKVDIQDCTFTGNTAPAGAAAYISNALETTISGSTFSGNTATKQGVIYLDGGDKHSLWNNTFANNLLNAKSNRTAAIAKTYGGAAIYAKFSDATPQLNIGHNTIVGNVAAYSGTVANFTGAAINIYGGKVILQNNIIAGNSTVAELGYGDVATDDVAIVSSTYNIYTSASAISYTSGSGDIVADSYDTGVAALTQTLDGSVAESKFVANLTDCGGFTHVVKPLATTFNGEEINVLKETSRVHRQLQESTFGVDLNRDGEISGTLTIDQRGVAREASTVPGACEYIDPAAIDDITVSQGGMSIATLGDNKFVISANQNIGQIAVYNLSGASVRSTSIGDSVYTLDLSDCTSGVYVVVAGDNAAKVVVK